MITRIRGIVLHLTKHTDALYILNLYTKEFGKIGLFINNPHNKRKSTIRIPHLNPLNILELDIEYQPTKTIHQIKSLHTCTSHHTTSDYIKDAEIMFLSEVISKSIKHEEEDTSLYEFIENGVKLLGETINGIENFHLVFLHKMSCVLGFGFECNDSEAKYCDLMNGIFTNQIPTHNHFILGNDTIHLIQLLNLEFDELQKLRLTRSERQRLLEITLEIYQLHIPGFGVIKSLEILKEVFD